MLPSKFRGKGLFFMDEYEIEKKCQSYEVTDFQHNFEIEHPYNAAAMGAAYSF